MPFNSPVFLLGFLPLAWAGFRLVGTAAAARTWYLVAVSLVFYGWWDWRFVPLLVGSVLANWLAARLYRRRRRPAVLTAAIALNLLCLGFYKYLGFAAET